MDHPEGAGSQRADRVDFDRRVRLEFRGAQISSDGGLLEMCELDDALGLSELASAALRDNRIGRNTVHRLDGLFRQSVFGRLAGYEDVNDADRLALDPVMRQIVSGRAVDAQAASASQMGRFETKTLALAENRAALADPNGHSIDRFHDRKGLKYITLDMDSSVSPTHCEQEGTAWNGHFECKCYHPLFVFNQFGMLERCSLRPSNVHSADDWQSVLKPVIARYAGRNLQRFFRGDAAFGVLGLYQTLEAGGYLYAIRLRANSVLQARIAHLLKRGPLADRPRGSSAAMATSSIRRHPGTSPAGWWQMSNSTRASCFRGWASSLPTCRCSRTGWCGSITSVAPPSSTSRKVKYAFHWTRLSCKRSRDNEVRLQLHALAYNLATFLRCIELPEDMADWSLTSLQLKLIKIGARVVCHARAITCQLAEVTVTGAMVRAILAAIRRLRAPPLCA